jgi:hypothetical protein
MIEGYWELETAAGEVLALQYPNGGLTRIAGVGMPPADYATQKAPGQHGSSHLGYVLADRAVQTGFAWRGRGGADCLFQRRAGVLYPIFSYLSHPLKLRYANLSGDVRELWNFWYQDGLGRDSDAVGDGVETAVAAWVARDPVWYDPTLHSYTVTVATGATGDELVFDTPAGVAGPTAIFGTAHYLTFGSSAINVTLNAGQITTVGDWFTFPVITVLGPASDFEIENVTAGYEITMDYDIAAGETVTLDLRYGYKTVTTDALAPPDDNLAGLVPSTDDLADFCLWGTRQVAGGANDVRLFCGNATSATRITVAWYDRYLAV